MSLAEVIDERVTEDLVTEYLLRPVGATGDCGAWVDVRDIRPGDLEPRSREALCGNREIAAELWMPPLTTLETVALLALLRLGLDAYRTGAPGKTAAVLDGIPQATFDNLARKLNRGL